MDNEHKVEIAILTFLIILQIMDFFEILPGDLDFAKKLISWTALGYLFIKVSPTLILFGQKKIKFDIAIILTYFLFTIKNIIGYAHVAVEETILFSDFHLFLVDYAMQIETYSLYLATLLIFFISLYAAIHFKILKPSFMSLLQKIEKNLIIRLVTIFLVLIAFFLIIFNLAVEWLAIAIDAPLVVIGILFYLFIIIRHHKKFHPKNFIYKIGNFGENFYENFVSMFHYKKRLYLGIMGLLALHLLTDIGNFIIPYIVGLKDNLYFGQLGLNHEPLFSLFLQDLGNPIISVFIAIAYLLNIIAMLFLLLLPAFVWYRFFKRKLLHVSRTLLALTLSSLVCFILLPVFIIRRIQTEGLAGVDILTQSIMQGFSVFDHFFIKSISIIFVVLLCAIIFISVWLLEYKKKIKKDLFIIAALAGLLFFGFYVYYYSTSISIHYVKTILALFEISNLFLAILFIAFAVITIAFYIGGYFLFIYEVFRRHFFKS